MLNDLKFTYFPSGNTTSGKKEKEEKTKINKEFSIEEVVYMIKDDYSLKIRTLVIRKKYAFIKQRSAFLNELLKKEDSNQEEIDALQKELEELEAACKKSKVEMPIITIHAHFTTGRGNKDPHTYYNIILTDIDHISDEQVNDLIPRIAKLSYVLFACRSVRGEGIHIISRIEVSDGINDDNFKDVFKATTRLIEYKLNIEADYAVGTISRCMFLNHDENAYYNPEATPLNVDTALWLERNNSFNLNIESSMNKREQLGKYLDVTDPNLNWSEGGRHNQLVSLASNLNRAGFDVEDVVAECVLRYKQTGFDADEIETTIRDVYHRYSSEHDTNQQSFTPPKGQRDKRT